MQTLSDERIPRSVISLRDCQHARSEEGARASLCRTCSSCELQQFAQSVSAFGEVLAHLPKAKQGRTETQAPLGISGFSQPFKRRAKIIMFVREAPQPFRSSPAALLRSPFFRQH